ncbi:type II toxin-antitoxin system RelE/ParE family toxin [Mucilaginibacter sp. 14171R-50]|uniref:type II toxin-antitoxin system RelE family toxin n=1 Tax=Mucilaginibacter sp. 14171R-50 TaxID=2703789 RepID=UPI00138CC9DA|nr:type II toxin-antitoxin system RelE/ParE family toxin [Mucilaginibacter sp. 14171R-50]QHS56019.1 type II toxin-antitoxin system RelE/ParE family toxin [Mucilaginibacter sp. 14171R-50]
MAVYNIAISKSAQKQLNKLQEDIADRIIESIYELANDPRPTGCKKLKGREAYRIRVGNYRVIYEIFDKVLQIDIIALGHRKDIYN